MRYPAIGCSLRRSLRAVQHTSVATWYAKRIPPRPRSPQGGVSAIGSQRSRSPARSAASAARSPAHDKPFRLEIFCVLGHKGLQSHMAKHRRPLPARWRMPGQRQRRHPHPQRMIGRRPRIREGIQTHVHLMMQRQISSRIATRVKTKPFANDAFRANQSINGSYWPSRGIPQAPLRASGSFAGAVTTMQWRTDSVCFIG